jgi:hypothetical protein
LQLRLSEPHRRLIQPAACSRDTLPFGSNCLFLDLVVEEDLLSVLSLGSEQIGLGLGNAERVLGRVDLEQHAPGRHSDVLSDRHLLNRSLDLGRERRTAH